MKRERSSRRVLAFRYFNSEDRSEGVSLQSYRQRKEQLGAAESCTTPFAQIHVYFDRIFRVNGEQCFEIEIGKKRQRNSNNEYGK